MRLTYHLFQINQGITEFETEEYQYWIIVSGDGQLDSLDCTIFLASHDVLDIPFHKKFQITCTEDMQIGCIKIHDFQSNNTNFQKKDREHTEIVRKIFYFALDFKGLQHECIPGLLHYVDQFMYEALLRTGLEEYKINPQLGKAIEEMNLNILNADFDIDAVIKKSGYSQSYFRKIFKEETGLSPIGYMQKQRIDRAKYLLQQDVPLTIREISEKCAFTDVYYFSRVFHKITGMSPTEYRSEVKNF